MTELNRRGHKTNLDVVDGVFKRLCIAFREGMQAYRPYFERGIAVDRTFLKISIGEVLLVVCFRNGNNEIQIVGVGVVSAENEDNWTWLLKYVLSLLQPASAFVISDRKKRLIRAVMTTAPDVPHFYCFRHLMDNFNKKFKPKQLKYIAWVLARSRTRLAYKKAEANLINVDKSALDWLQEVGPKKWSTALSPRPRYNTLTSNNVEAVNSALKGIGSLPIIDSLMEIERYIARKWTENANKVKEWGKLTPYVSRKVDKTLANAEYGETYASSTSSYIVTIRPGIGSIPVKFAVHFCDKTVRCSCEYFEDINASRVHALLALKYINKLPDMTAYFHDSWKTSAFVDAYSELSEHAILPLVLKDSLTSGACMSPSISKKRGRPKKKRIPSQQATEILESRQIRRCGICKQTGHNRKICPG